MDLVTLTALLAALGFDALQDTEGGLAHITTLPHGYVILEALTPDVSRRFQAMMGEPPIQRFEDYRKFGERILYLVSPRADRILLEIYLGTDPRGTYLQTIEWPDDGELPPRARYDITRWLSSELGLHPSRLDATSPGGVRMLWGHEEWMKAATTGRAQPNAVAATLTDFAAEGSPPWQITGLDIGLDAARMQLRSIAGRTIWRGILLREQRLYALLAIDGDKVFLIAGWSHPVDYMVPPEHSWSSSTLQRVERPTPDELSREQLMQMFRSISPWGPMHTRYGVILGKAAPQAWPRYDSVLRRYLRHTGRSLRAAARDRHQGILLVDALEAGPHILLEELMPFGEIHAIE